MTATDTVLGRSPLSPDLRSRLVVGAVAAHVLAATVLTAVVGTTGRAYGDRLVWLAALLAVPPLVAVLVVSARAPERGSVGEVLTRAGLHAPVLLVGAAVDGALALAVGAVTTGGRDHAYGGAGLGMLIAGGAGTIVLLLLGPALAFPVAMRGRLPWPLRASAPLVLGSVLPVAVGLTLGTERSVAASGRTSTSWRALLGLEDVASRAWLTLGHVSVLLLALGLVLLVQAGRRLHADGDPAGATLLHPRWLRRDDDGPGTTA